MIINDKSPKTYVVLGAHRSGTSFIAKALQMAGIRLVGNDDNCYEDPDFLRFNRTILDEAYANGTSLVDHEILQELALKHKDEFLELIETKKSQMWGWKDPVQLRTLEPLLDCLTDDVYLICVFRKPERCAKSHQEMWGTNDGANVTKEYARRLIKVIEKFMGLNHD